MAFPISNYTRVWVRGYFVDLAKAGREEASWGVTGPVQFIPSPEVLVDQATKQVIDCKPFVVFPRASDGYFEIQLPATNDPDLNPTGWTYNVIEPTGRDYHIVVPYDTPAVTTPGDALLGQQVIELANVVPNPEANPGTVQLLAGIAGRGISSVSINGSNRLVGTYTDGTSWDAGIVTGVTQVNGMTGAVTLTKSDVGLGNVNNTSDANKPISTATQTALDSKAATVHNHPASEITSGQLSTSRMPQVAHPIKAGGNVTGAVATVATEVNNFRNYTATGDLTISVPTGGVDHQVIRYAILASGATRTVTFNASFRLSTGLSSRTFSVPSGEILIAAIEYSSLITAWVLTAATVSAT